jgi:hypothetical protein
MRGGRHEAMTVFGWQLSMSNICLDVRFWG